VQIQIEEAGLELLHLRRRDRQDVGDVPLVTPIGAVRLNATGAFAPGLAGPWMCAAVDPCRAIPNEA